MMVGNILIIRMIEFKKTNTIEQFKGSLFGPRKFKYGHKQLLVLLFIKSKKRSVKYNEIIKYAYELSWGLNSFNPKENRGYWSSVFGINYYWTDFNWGSILLTKYKLGYRVNRKGKEKIKKLLIKFPKEKE